jgi:RNA polymerase sigma factor (sigma-70 family)
VTEAVVEPAAPIQELLRELAPQVLGALMRRYRDFDTAEDAVQEALLTAALTWPREGLPESPRAWLIQVASRRLTDQLRSERARRRREEAVGEELQREEEEGPTLDLEPGSSSGDDTLALLFMCCHPSLTAPSAIALTLRAVGGLDTAEIAHAFLVPEATMAQRISRAKATIKASAVPFQLPAAAEQPARLKAVLHVLYLIFNEGYTSSFGPELLRQDLASEAIRLTRGVHQLLPDHGEVAGLLALMLLTDARRRARTTPGGDLVPLAEQDRSLWDRDQIAEGIALVTSALSRAAIGPYQLQAAIAAIHDEASTAADTDWPQLLAFYSLLSRMDDNPMVLLNRAVALAMVKGPPAGLAALEDLARDPRLASHHRLAAVRAHLHEMAGDLPAASEQYRLAATRTASLPEQRYLLERAARLDPPPATPRP